MIRRVLLVLASALLAGSLVVTAAEARGGGHGGGFGGGHMGGFGGGGHMGGFGGGHIGGFGGAHIGGFAGPHFGGSRIAGLHGEHFHARGPFIGGFPGYGYSYDCPYYPPYRYGWNNYNCVY